MNWINVHERLPRDGQRVLVWSGDIALLAAFESFDCRFRGDAGYCIAGVQYWADVSIPKQGE